MSRIQINEPSLMNYTGNFGGIEFVDGVSVEPVSRAEKARIGASIRAIDFDSGKQVGPAVDVLVSHAARNPTPEASADETVVVIGNGSKDASDEAQKALADATALAAAQAVANAPASLTYDFTRESLEEKADKGGIKALRELAEPYGVRARGIVEIVDELMAAKAKHEAQKEQ